MHSAKERLIVALDVEAADRALDLFEALRNVAGMFKVGSHLFTAAGPDIVRQIVARGGRVFLDLKFHDIPNTVAAAGIEATRLGVSIFNVHASGGAEMMKRTARQPQTLVTDLAQLAAGCGLDGVVASPQEIEIIREKVSRPDFLIVTPGIRAAGDKFDDQKRVMTTTDAIRAGADYLVVGRPILDADDPVESAQLIVREIDAALTDSANQSAEQMIRQSVQVT